MRQKNSRQSNPNSANLRHGNWRQKIAELQAEREALFSHSGDAVFILDSANHEIIEANARAAHLTGYSMAELAGMRLSQFMAGPSNISASINSLLNRGEGKSRGSLEQKDGTVLCVEFTVCRIIRDQVPMHLILVREVEQGRPGRTLPGDVDTPVQPFGNGRAGISEPVYEFPNIIGKSEIIRKTCQLIGQVAKTDCTVLIQGESGTGKEIVAQATHYYSHRSTGPFIRVNCAALAETLLESELFGHVKGAFTGAIRDRKGRFMQAQGGTLLLDEIGCMSLSGQAKLLRVLEEREFEPVGSSNTRTVNVRVIAASKSNLKKAVAEGRFREDLYYRLNVFSIYMPPLRDRKEDIPLLAQHFLKKFRLAMGKGIQELTPETLALMMQYEWPGNVRELRNVIEHAVIVAKGPVIYPADLPSNMATSAA
ncbi:MAG: PAS domain S-box protein, partial [Calditrichaeota bacterium]